MDGKSLDRDTVRSVGVYLAVYVGIFCLSFFLVNLFDQVDFETSVSAVTACYNNIGPGFSMVGPMSNYAFFSVPSKIILIFDMLAGRLELFPMLMLFVPEVWKKAGKKASEEIRNRNHHT